MNRLVWISPLWILSAGLLLTQSCKSPNMDTSQAKDLLTYHEEAGQNVARYLYWATKSKTGEEIICRSQCSKDVPIVNLTKAGLEDWEARVRKDCSDRDVVAVPSERFNNGKLLTYLLNEAISKENILRVKYTEDLKKLDDVFNEHKSAGVSTDRQSIRNNEPVLPNIENPKNDGALLTACKEARASGEPVPEWVAPMKLPLPGGSCISGPAGMVFCDVPGKSWQLQQTEVTRLQFKTVRGVYPENPLLGLAYKRCNEIDKMVLEDNHPASCVQWKEANNFASLMNKKADDG